MFTNDHIHQLISLAEKELQPVFAHISAIVDGNQTRVLDAFHAHRVELRHFAGSSGYGYDDAGRDTLDLVFADALQAEKALVRPQIVSGTHALSLALYALCAGGGHILCVTGAPYDTLCSTIGITEQKEDYPSLRTLGVHYTQLELQGDGAIDIRAMQEYLSMHQDVTLLYLQRSRGYAWRPSLQVTDIKTVVQTARQAGYRGWIVVDNCYGEFTELQEPTSVGVDLIVGSLIKNPGGGLAPTGAYFAGRTTCVDRIQYRLTAPGIGAEVGSWESGYRAFYQGLFLAPHVVGESLKGMALMAHVFAQLGLRVTPQWQEARADIVQSIEFGTAERLLAFCKAIQSASPIDSHVVPESWPMPGYQNDIVMAAGTFVQGASIELSADGPIRAPYIGYMQGGLTYEHCKYALRKVLTTF